MPEMTFVVQLRVKVSEEGANVNEILQAARVARDQFGVHLTEAVIEWVQEVIRDRLCGGDRRAKKGLGSHEKKGEAGRKCGGRRFVKEGYRGDRRGLNTGLGWVEFSVGYVSCQRCGKKWAPILKTLGLDAREGHSGDLEREVVEAVNRTSFARGPLDVEGLTGVPTSRSSGHRWLAEMKVPDMEPPPLRFLMADGTGFKKAGGKRGELRVAIGVTTRGEVVGLGTWSGVTWEQIGRELKRRLKKSSKPELAVVDGETGLDNHFASLAHKAQRSRWHLLRDLRSRLWHDDLKKKDIEPFWDQLSQIVGIEIPAGEWEDILVLEKQAIRERVEEARKKFQEMIDEFGKRGYTHGAEYLQNAKDRIFSRIELWLRTGIIAPSSTGLLEEIMRELGRRVKKLGWNWTDHGITQQAKLILVRRYDEEQWNDYWKRRLDLRDRCRIEITCFGRAA
jgi:hypothetical protein